jgi:hypothetical protein
LKGVAKNVVFGLSCRYNGTKKWRKNLQDDENTSIFAVRKTKNLKQVTTNKNNNPLKNIRL